MLRATERTELMNSEGRVYEGVLNGEGLRFAIVASRFNEFIGSKLISGAKDCLIRHGASPVDIDLAWVPGSFEIPLAAQRLARSKKYDAVICVGAVIRGNTPHFDYVAGEVTKGIAQVQLETGIPVVFGVLTTDTIEQAVERAGTKSGNRGWDAAQAAVEMANLIKELDGPSKK
jgi:6,7-dimethyl-8-ribityllumazine synthase